MKDSIVDILINDLQYEDLNPDCQAIADAIGMEAFKNLIKSDNAGIPIYPPKITSIKPVLKRYIIGQKSKSPKDIARELGFSIFKVREILKE